MSEFISTLFFFLVALGILITVHELGHFLVARKLGVKVLRFSVGFGKAVLRYRSRRDGTEYVLAALPLGGYVKMLDEREAPVPPEEASLAFNRQSLGVRSAIVAAGPIFNLLFAVLAYWVVLVTGETGAKAIVGEVIEPSVAEHGGFQTGDEIEAVGERKTPTWESVVYALFSESLAGQDLVIRVRDAGGSERVRWLESDAVLELADQGQVLKALGLIPFRPPIPPVVGDIVAGEPAQQAGLAKGDRVLSADGQPIDTWGAWVEWVRERPGQSFEVEVQRGGRILALELTPRAVETEDGVIGRIGAGVSVPEGFYDEYRAEVSYAPVEAIGQAFSRTWDMGALMLKMLGRMIIGEASIKNLSGPISIAETAGRSASYGVSYFIKFLAIVSISLGVLNLLPIPVLDGGHLLYFLIEAIKGGPLSETVLELGQKIGIAFLLALMTLVFYLDISRLLGS